MIRIYHIFCAPSIVDLFQVLVLDKPKIDVIYLLVAVGTGIIGSGVRIAYENDRNKVSGKKKVEKSRIIFILLCSLVVSYAIYVWTGAYDYRDIVGLISIAGGIISIDIIKFLIEDIPNIGKEFVRMKAKLKDKDDNNNNS